MIVEKVTKRYGTYRKCPTESCDWKLEIVPPEKKEAAAKAPAKKPAAKKVPAKSAKPKA